jgi:hypothetical protein
MAENAGKEKGEICDANGWLGRRLQLVTSSHRGRPTERSTASAVVDGLEAAHGVFLEGRDGDEIAPPWHHIGRAKI